MPSMELVLASSSPRRLEILRRLSIHPRLAPADIDETPRVGEAADAYVERLAREKAVTAASPTTVVVGADTAVVLDGVILGKPADSADAVSMLRRLSGRDHEVLTGVAVVVGAAGSATRVASAVESTTVSLRPVTDERIEWYVSTGEPDDKAGAYGIQGAAGIFADFIEGSVNNVVGLPLPLLDRLFRDLGLDLMDFSGDPDVDLVEAIGELALARLRRPPTSTDPVVRFRSPPELLELFAANVGIEFATDEPAHPTESLLEAVGMVFDHSVQTSHPRFINQNYAGADPVAVVGDWVGATLNTAASTFEIAPVFTMLERSVLTKLATIAGFAPDTTDAAPAPGMFCPGGSTSTLYALQLARHRSQPDLIRRGIGASRHQILVSEAGHYAAEKSAALLGIGTDNVVTIPSTPDGTMIPEALAEILAVSLAHEAVPLAVIATSGTTVTAAFDPLDEIANICAASGVWLHVDGCYGGSALFSPSQRHRMAGVERADSFVWNLHKMIGITQQCSALLVREPTQLADCFSAGADYLFQPDKQFGEYDPGDRTFQCGRRVDAMKLWLAWKAHGDAGFASRIDHVVGLADHVRRRVAASNGRFHAVVEGTFTNVCLTWVPPELRPLSLSTLDPEILSRLHRLQPRIKARMQTEGTAMVGYQRLGGVNVFRLLFMNPAVTTADADDLLALIERYGSEEWVRTLTE